MEWLFAATAVVVLGVVAIVAAGRSRPMPPPGHSRPEPVPEGRLEAADLRRARFSLAVRGYRMSEVDALLDRMAAQMEDDRGDGEAAEQ